VVLHATASADLLTDQTSTYSVVSAVHRVLAGVSGDDGIHKCKIYFGKLIVLSEV